ncbi:unnamed protein product [Dracunculus medinensis]|uniref:Peptidase_M13_N domain-containing protein n=1 Tax=Dracunculus medinensis TaxID=318479 RepID=A0A0N4UQS0_DRAME|nr:unnamed protein product [Dracunculus medinensis]
MHISSIIIYFIVNNMRATMIDYSTRLWLILAILIINDKFMQTEQILGIISVPNADWNSPSLSDEIDVGISSGYVKASNLILGSIDEKFDPCVDFFKFACGKWIEHNPIPDDMVHYGILTLIRERVSSEMKALNKELSGSGPTVSDIFLMFDSARREIFGIICG